MKLTVSGAALADLKRLQAFLADKDINTVRRAVAEIILATPSFNATRILLLSTMFTFFILHQQAQFTIPGLPA